MSQFNQPMFGGMSTGNQMPRFNGMGNSNGGQSPLGGYRSSDEPMGPPSDLQNPQPGWSPIMPGYEERPNFPSDPNSPPPSPPPGWDQSPVDTWGRPDRQEGDPVNPQKQDKDGNWYEWTGHTWRPTMGRKPDIYPVDNLTPILKGLKGVRPIWSLPFSWPW